MKIDDKYRNIRMWMADGGIEIANSFHALRGTNNAERQPAFPRGTWERGKRGINSFHALRGTNNQTLSVTRAFPRGARE